MPKCSELITIKEYEGFSSKESPGNYHYLKPDVFSALETFVLTNNGGNKADGVELMTLSARKNAGKVICAKNYVGLISLNDGTTIEILPKIAGLSDDADNGSTKRVLIEMLRTLKDAPFKEFNSANLKTEKLSLFEISIKMFLDEAVALSKQGLKSAYVETEENERFYKGKLLVSQNIHMNAANKARFYVRYDEFSVNRPENKLIKSTLKHLLNLTRSQSISHEIAKLLSEFERVDYSKDYDSDFSKASADRTMKRYTKLMNWCKLFLKGNSFTAYAGDKTAIALLFPMERIFESYIAALFSRNLTSNYAMSAQDNAYSLFDRPKKAFNLRPDIVLRNARQNIVIDTKWKLLSPNEGNYGISQSDMYQMYAYGKKYSSDEKDLAAKVILLYPKTAPEFFVQPFSSDDGVNVEVKFLDLSSMQATEETINEIFAWGCMK